MRTLFFLYRRNDGELGVGGCADAYPITPDTELSVEGIIAQIRSLLQPTVTPIAGSTATPVAIALPPAGTTGHPPAGTPPWLTVAIGGALAAATLLSGHGWRLLRRR